MILITGTALPAQAQTTADWLPFQGNFSAEVGCTWNNGCDGGYHNGTLGPAIDFIVNVGTPVHAAGPGVIVGFNDTCHPTNSPGCSGSRGRYVEIAHPDGRHSRYLHLSDVVKTGGNVALGELLGFSGNSGGSPVPHLHYDETINGTKVDPGAMYAKHGAALVQYPNALNGSYTSWNLVPAWSGKTVHSDGYTTPGGQPDVNGDGRADLIIALAGPTGSGQLEAHVLDAASNYGSFAGNWATPAGYLGQGDRLSAGDVNGDGRIDLVIIGTGLVTPTGSGRLEAHVLNGATGFTSWLGHWATAAGYLGSPADQVLMGDFNGDRRADIVIVATGQTGPTGSGRLEAHILDGANGFNSWLGNLATAAGYITAGDRVEIGDFNADGRADLVIVATGLTQPTGSGKLEAHVLNAATAYNSWLGNVATAAGYLGSAADQTVMGDFNGDGRSDLFIMATGRAGPTGSGRLEAHILNGANAFSSWLGNLPTAAGYLGYDGDTILLN